MTLLVAVVVILAIASVAFRILDGINQPMTVGKKLRDRRRERARRGQRADLSLVLNEALDSHKRQQPQKEQRK